MLAQLIMQGKIKIGVDQGAKATTGPFVGLEKVVDAVEVCGAFFCIIEVMLVCINNGRHWVCQAQDIFSHSASF